MKTFREKLNEIRMPVQFPRINAVTAALICFASGTVLGIISKWLDNLALDSTVWWHRLLETLDLGNFFSEFAVWLLLALIIAVYSSSARRAALNVFVFFAGMCVAYHVYTIVFSGFDPGSYMMIWYGITLLSPLLAVICWYAKGNGPFPVIIDTAIIAVMALYCFSIGWIYFSIRGVLYLLVFAAAAAVLYRDRWQFLISLTAGILLSFLISPAWPYR